MVLIVPSLGKFYVLAFSSRCLIRVIGVAISLVLLWFIFFTKSLVWRRWELAINFIRFWCLSWREIFPSIWRNMVSAL